MNFSEQCTFYTEYLSLDCWRLGAIVAVGARRSRRGVEMKAILFCVASLMFSLGVGAQAPTSQPNAASPVIVRFVAPPYPRMAKDNRMMVTTVSELSVALDGSVSEVRTIQAHRVFETAVTSALKQWRFRALNQTYKLEVTVSFEFDDDSECTNKGTLTPETLVSADLPNLVRVKTGLPCLSISTPKTASRK